MHLSKITLISSLIFLLLFHLMEILGILPITLVWGGNLDNRQSLIISETIAFLITLLFLLITLNRLNYLQNNFLSKISKVGTWVMLAFFTLSFIGNLFAKTNLEKIIFLPLSLLLISNLIFLFFSKQQT